ncbi:MAG TPA: AAA family ATPase [Polyangiaceae bacterium]|nr:AAA family ATPase [Polyangiaceae bacterium]
MEGELEGIDLVEVLQVVGIGRQYTGVELRKADQTPFGTVFIKAGKVVSAVAGQARGRDAFFALFAQVATESRKFFHVFRMETPRELPEPVGSLGNLMLEALARSKNGGTPQKTSSGVMPRPTVVRNDNEPAKSPGAEVAPPSARQPAPPSQRRPSLASAPQPQRAAGAEPGSPPARQPSSTEIVARQGTPSSAGARRVALPGKLSGTDSDGSSARERGGGGKSRVVLGVVSPKGGSGKTTIALNLALSFARQDRSVTLVDGDINGDVLSAIASRQRATFGAIDVLMDKVSPEAALLKTVLPHLRIMPAIGEQLPDTAALLQDHSKGWQKLLRRLSEESEIVIVDGPAGMFGGTRQFLSSCTHVLGVLQAELIASRSFSALERALELTPPAERPEVVGVVLNMLQARHGASVKVLQDACAHLPKGWLLDTAIPRSDAFLDATQEGVPLRLLDEENPPAVSWLFDTLAGEITERLGLEVPERKPKPFLI